MLDNVLVALHTFTHLTPHYGLQQLCSGFSKKWKAQLRGLTEEILMKGVLSEVWLRLSGSSRNMNTSVKPQEQETVNTLDWRKQGERTGSSEQGDIFSRGRLLAGCCGHSPGCQTLPNPGKEGGHWGQMLATPFPCCPPISCPGPPCGLT